MDEAEELASLLKLLDACAEQSAHLGERGSGKADEQGFLIFESAFRRASAALLAFTERRAMREQQLTELQTMAYAASVEALNLSKTLQRLAARP